MDIVVIFELQEMGEVELLSQIQNYQHLVREINKFDQCPSCYGLFYKDEEGDLIVINEGDDFQYQEIYVIESQDCEGINKFQQEAVKSNEQQQFDQPLMENFNIQFIENLINSKIETRIEQLINDFGLKQVVNQNHDQENQVLDKGQDIYQDLIDTLRDLSQIHNQIKQINEDDNYNQLIQNSKIKSGFVKEYQAKIKTALANDIADAKKRIDLKKRQSQQKSKK